MQKNQQNMKSKNITLVVICFDFISVDSFDICASLAVFFAVIKNNILHLYINLLIPFL